MHAQKFDISLVLLLLICLVSTGSASAREVPPSDSKYHKFFRRYVDERSLPERTLNIIGLSAKEVGRSFALLVGVSRYPQMSETLKPAEVDIIKLYHYLKNYEFFDEIVVLMNDDFTEKNLRYFLQVYFPNRVAEFPKSRFLFGFSGHGMNDGSEGYLLESSAHNLKDKANAINLRYVRTMLQEVIYRGYHILALVNACYGGNFFRRSFGKERFRPTLPGAHAITAGGAKELVYADPDVGPGSVFFEKFFAGLDQLADTFPPAKSRGDPSGDGVITVDELATWLKLSIRQWHNEKVNPEAGDLSTEGSPGGFFFLNRRRQIEWNLVTPHHLTQSIPEAMSFSPKKPVLELENINRNYIVRQNAKVYKRPTHQSIQVGSLWKGTKVLVIGQIHGKKWYLVEHNGEKGYVLKSLLDVASEQEPSYKEYPRPTFN